jgi:hypothetical protein
LSSRSEVSAPSLPRVPSPPPSVSQATSRRPPRLSVQHLVKRALGRVMS